MSKDYANELLNQGAEADRADYKAGYGNTDPQAQADKAGNHTNNILAAQRAANGVHGVDKSDSTSMNRYSGDTPDYGTK